MSGHKMEDFEKAKWPRQIIGAVLGGCVITGLLFLSFQFFTAWTSSFLLFFLDLIIAIPVWFGTWGIIAAVLSILPVFDRAIHSHLILIFWVIVFLQASIPAWAFRHFEADPRLKTIRDFKIFLVYDVTLASLATAVITFLFGPYAVGYGYIFSFGSLVVAIASFILSFVARMIFGIPLLLLGSRIVIKAKTYCRGWFS